MGSHRMPRWLGVLCAAIGLWLVAPSLVVLPLSFTDRDSFAFPPTGWSLRYYRKFFTDPDWWGSMTTSLRLALLVAVVATLAGSAAAYGLVRGGGRGKVTATVLSVVNGLLMAPMVTPGIVAAVAVYSAFLDAQLVGTSLGFVLAHTALGLPFVIVTVSGSLRTVDRRLELAAAGLGAGPWAVFRRVTLPLIMPGVLSGAVFAFVTSFDEVVFALFLQSPTLRTLPVKMFTSVTAEVDPTIAAASSLIITVTTALVLAPTLFRRKVDHS